MRLRNTIYNNRGDTIVEVLIALAILGFAMSIAYSITSRSLAVIRSSQERIEALKLAEGQIEQMKSIAEGPNAGTLFPTIVRSDPFCINDSGQIVNHIAPLPLSATTDTFISYHGECKSQGPGSLYNISVFGPTVAKPALFEVRVRWNRFGGGVNEELKLEYELFKGTP